MGRLFGIVSLLLGVWAAAEIFTQGYEGAFGGALSGFASSEEEGNTPGTSQMNRVRMKIDAAQGERTERQNALLGDS